MKPKTRIILLSIISILIVVTIVLGVTYSFMQANIDSSEITEVSLSSCAKISLEDSGVSIDLNNTSPISKNKALQTTPYTFSVTSDCESYVGFNMYLATLNTNTLVDSSIHYIITSQGSKNILAEGILSEATNALSEFTAEEQAQLNSGINGTFGTIYRLYNDSIPLQGEVSYDLYLYIDSDVTDASTMGKTFNAGIAVKSYDREAMLADVCNSGDNLANCIKEYNTMAGDGAEGIYYHDGAGSYTNASQEAGDNSYRFSGANPNNYVCFGSDEETCPTENLYRIIGIFDDDKDTNYQIKLIKADYTTSGMLGTDGRDYDGTYNYSTSNYKGSMETSTIAGYRWNYDTSVSTYGSNNWTTSEFNTINLNTNYWNYLGTTWQNLIAETTWHLGGMTSNGNTAKAFYDGERNNAGYGSNPTTYTDEIGLMYPSDYGYAASPDAWATSLSSYSSSTITTNNWMYMRLNEWTITPYSSSSRSVFRVTDYGNLNNHSANRGYAARPVFYLKSGVTYVSGNGTKGNPFRIDYEVPLADHIKGLYASNEGANGIYLHDGQGAYGSLEAGDNSYRYSGANPNNFVCFGATGADCQNEENQYRIIGVFNNQVKLIKATSYGSYVWEQDYSTQGNTWDASTKPDIYTTLNTTYYNTLSSEWQNLIAETTWQVGGMVWSETNTAKQYYDVEVGTGQSGYVETMKIGLMYVSDYGYGASPEKWTTALYEENYGTDNWLYLGSNEWLISRDAVNTGYAFDVYSSNGGSVFDGSVGFAYAVRPSFSLTSTATISSGTGTSTDPFVLNLG